MCHQSIFRTACLFLVLSGFQIHSEERSAQLRALWINPSLPADDPKAAGVMHAEIRVRENTMVDENGRLAAQVTCSTSVPNARNDQWQSAAWMAAFVASREKGVQLTENEFQVRVPSPIDGPSASMAVAVTMLALMNGDALMDDWVITGTIGPDGTIGPVGGIDRKIGAAAKKGPDGVQPIRRFGFPMGQRMYSPDGEEFVDLVSMGKKLGFDQVVEISGIDDAYEFATKKPLKTKWSEIKITSEDLHSPELTVPTLSRLSASLRDFKQFFPGEFADKKRLLDERIAKEYSRRALPATALDEAEEYFARVELAHKGGALTQAYFNSIRARTDLEIAEISSQLLEPASHGTKTSVIEVLRKTIDAYIKVRKRVAAARLSLQDTISDATMGGSLFTRLEGLNASVSLCEGIAYHKSAENMFYSALIQLSLAEKEASKSKAATVKLTDNFFESLQKTSEYFSAALVRYRTAQDWYSFSVFQRTIADVEVRMGPEFYDSIGHYYHKGAEAALAYVNATLSQKWESEYRKANESASGAYVLNFDEFPHQKAFREPSYLPLALATRHAEPNLTHHEGLSGWMQKNTLGSMALVTPDEESVESYGSGVTAFVGLSALIFRHYNYQNNTALMRNSRSYGMSLDRTRERTLTRIAQLRSLLATRAGIPSKEVVLPSAISLNVELADTLRYGDSDDMLTSFKVYWRATFLCDLALRMIELADK